jgi:UDP-glucose 6-dehydrogenase
MIKTAKDAKKALKIGFIGQGYVGKNYADDFEKRGFSVVRYALEEPYRKNKKYIQNCDIVFIAVPTPTTSKGFSYAIVDEALSLVKPGKIAVIKSTILPGTTERLQKKHPKLTVLFSPEFLGESTAAHDVANPFANVIGLPKDDMKHRKAADLVFAVLPRVPSCIATKLFYLNLV